MIYKYNRILNRNHKILKRDQKVSEIIRHHNSLSTVHWSKVNLLYMLQVVVLPVIKLQYQSDKQRMSKYVYRHYSYLRSATYRQITKLNLKKLHVKPITKSKIQSMTAAGHGKTKTKPGSVRPAVRKVLARSPVDVARE